MLKRPPPAVAPGRHGLLKPNSHQYGDFLKNLVELQRAALPANVRNHTERAAVVTSILHFEVGPGAFVGCVEDRGRQEFGVGEYVGNENQSSVVSRWSLA